MDNTEQQDLESSADSFKIDNLKRPNYFEGIDRDHRISLDSSEKSSNRKTLILILILFLVLGGIGGFLFYKYRPTFKAPVPSPTPTPVPSPTEAPQALDKSEWILEIQNGSGITGEAKKIADKLKELGYTIAKTGNADKSNYETSEFYVKAELMDKANLIVADIKDVVKIASISGELKSSSDSTASARIILGKDIE